MIPQSDLNCSCWNFGYAERQQRMLSHLPILNRNLNEPMNEVAMEPVTQVETAQPRKDDDLSRTLEKSLNKLSGESIRCVRVYGNCYRCNWWQSDAGDGNSSVPTNRIVMSRFLRATASAEGV